LLLLLLTPCVVYTLTYHMSHTDEHELRRAFMIYDYDGTDSADEYSLTRGLALTNLFTSHSTINNVLAHGTDHKLDFTEFCVVYLQHERFSEDAMRQVR
jgi:Ca2+-binding EF-hand superfamily protein